MRISSLRVCLFLGLVGSSTGVGACFTGQDALGLPCKDDRDCGLDQTCIEGFCGGVMLTGGSTGTTTGTGTTGPDPFCGDGNVDAGEQCDDGNSDNTDACLDTCEDASCGDGFVGPGEGCDDGNMDDTDDCTNMCALGSCGDGIEQMGEPCDDGNMDDTDACLNTCVPASCGDGAVWAGMEECDDGNTIDDATCLADCRDVYFWDDMEASNMEWSHTKVSGDVTDQWDRAQGEAHGGVWAWHSGTQASGVAPFGDTRLETRDIDLTGVTGEVELRFWHLYDFDDCDTGTPNNEADGAAVEVFSAGAWSSLTPVPAYNNSSLGTADCTNMDGTPLAGSPGWAGTSGAWQEVTVVLDAYAGETIRIGFHVGWDCANCMGSEEDGWFIDDVRVARPAM